MLSGALLLLAALACAVPARPRIAEILYDAAGDDTGFEFVELLNPTPAPLALAGVRLEAGDGSGPGRWTLRWTGGAADSIAAGGRFVIGGARVLPPPHAVVSLDLQNGPDAVRLVFPDGTAEVVGYGAHDLAEYACGDPAADAPSGFALARLPDDADLGANALDFRAAAPTPGAANQPARDAAIVPGSLALHPSALEPGASARLALAVANLGREAIAAGTLRLAAHATGTFGESVLAHATHPLEIAAGDTATIELETAPLVAGRQRITCRVRVDGDQREANDGDSLRVLVGPGPLEITEIQFHPVADEGEWVEVRNRSAEPLALTGFTLSDRGTTRGKPRGGGAPCAPESLAVLAQDRAALLARFPALDSTRVWHVSPWPSLNNANDASGTADAVVVRDADGVGIARHDYSAAGIPAGVPVERGAAGLWEAATEPGGSPLRPARPLAPITGRFEVAPRRLAGAAADARLAWSLPWPRARVAAELYTLSGARLAPVLAELAAPGRGERRWRPAGIGPGVYVLVFHARPDSGGESFTVTRVVRIDQVAR